MWLEMKLGIYCEFFYYVFGYDIIFDLEFVNVDEIEVCCICWKNINYYFYFDIVDGGLVFI